MADAFDLSGVLTVLAVAGGLFIVATLLARAHQKLLLVGVQQAAEKVERLLLCLADPAPHDVLVAAAADDRHDARFREHVRVIADEAKALGFVELGDFEDRTAQRATPEQPPAVLRALRSDNGAILLGVTGREHQGKIFVTIETTSEIRASDSSANDDDKDVRFIETIAIGDLPMLDQGPRIDLERLPLATSLAELLARHEARLAAVRVGEVIVPAKTVDELIQRYHRRVRATAAHRASLPALITRDELLALGGAEPAVVDMVYGELVRRAANRR